MPDYGVQHLLVLVQRLDGLVFGLRELAQHVHRGDATLSVQILYYRYRFLQLGPGHVAAGNPGHYGPRNERHGFRYYPVRDRHHDLLERRLTLLSACLTLCALTLSSVKDPRVKRGVDGLYFEIDPFSPSGRGLRAPGWLWLCPVSPYVETPSDTPVPSRGFYSSFTSPCLSRCLVRPGPRSCGDDCRGSRQLGPNRARRRTGSRCRVPGSR